MPKELLKPYRRTKNKLFFKKGKLKMSVTRVAVGTYKFDGDVIADTSLDINFNNYLRLTTEIQTLH